MANHLGHVAINQRPLAMPEMGIVTRHLRANLGSYHIEVPRDRNAQFKPQIIPKHQTRWTGFDDKIISLYARGMLVREI